MKELCAAVLIKAVQDWKIEEHRDEIRSFFNSEYGELYCEFLNLSPKYILEKLETNAINLELLEVA
jgi:hypothetical protein